jgi:hypothetical protein
MRVQSRGKASFRGVLLGSSEDSLRLVDDELGEVALALREVESVRQDAGF